MHTFEFYPDYETDDRNRGKMVKIHHDPGSMNGAAEITYGQQGLSVPKRALFEFVAEESRKAMIDQFTAELEEMSPDAILGLASQEGLAKSLELE